MPDTVHCPHCTEEIDTATLRALEADNAKRLVKFWTCPNCETILGPTQ